MAIPLVRDVVERLTGAGVAAAQGCSADVAAPAAAGCSALGARWASAAAARLAAPGITTGRPAARPSTAALATSAAGTHMNFGQRLARLGVGHPRRLGEAGLDGPRAQRRDRHAGAAQLGAERAAVGEHERLRRAVAGLAGQRLEGGGGRGVQDGAAVAGHHARRRTACTGRRRPRRWCAPWRAPPRGRPRCTGPMVVKPALLTRMSTVSPRSLQLGPAARRASRRR